ncbi:N-arginine dibasic convertase NRD1, Zn2+-dependent endopeptidase, insulinase superfamily [Trachipleistophora hominis]|uniref:N-arginine dibasic convertase NRD1, Zn2+-dependent endopeptidase, insulinase superfamily n=1 Tax=Trachipleistophora hominis TaxID=72359 RepID=L7JXZ1_TRAHO|nr:N-arginine dibasic convertase NRD1, Zn2+-dependent endopeptidase, insulinase superfamily [Trachipleistophora hominis]
MLVARVKMKCRTKTKNAPKINDFDSFLNTYNGDSNAYTAEDETVYHYELDNAGMLQSFRLFSNFFKHPLINKRTVASESQVVDSEFQNRKNDDESRINRILEISAGKKFSIGSLLSLGNDYEELKSHCEDLYAKRYRKMVLVVCSSERNEDMKKILEDSFSLDLDAVVYTERTCVICSKHGLNGKLETEHEFKDQEHVPNGESQSAEDAFKEQQNDGNDLKITKLYKYRPIFPKKRVIVSVSLPSEHVQYHNVYDSLIYFFTKEDHSSLLYALKNSRLIFNGTVCTTTTQRETMVCFDFTVPSTDTYTAIVHEINRYFQIYKKSQGILSYYSKIEKDVNWQLYEEDDMRAHVVDCAERMLRSKVLFSDLMCEHECTNLALNECTVVLVDDDYECEKVAGDEYELCYEEIKCVGCADDRKLGPSVLNGSNCVADDRKSEHSAHENISTTNTQPVNLHCSQRTPGEQNDRLFTMRHPVGSIIKDKDVNAALKVIESAQNKLVFIKDSFQTTKTVIQLFLCYRTSIMDVINFTELIDQLNVVYNHVLRTNAISVTHHVFHDGVLFEIAGLDPFFVLLNVLNFDGILEMMSSTTCTLNVLNDVKVSLEDEMYDAGYVRTSNSIKNVYIEGYSTVEREYEMVKDMIDDLRVRESAGTGKTGTSRQFIPYNEVQSVLLIVNGCSNEECYHDVFKKICARIKGKGSAPKLRIREEYTCTQDVFSVLNEGNKKFSRKETNGRMSTCNVTSPERVGDKPMKLNECLVLIRR